MAHVILHNPLNAVLDSPGDGMDEGGIRPSEYNNPHDVIIDASLIDHAGLANLGVGNPHPQYLLASAFTGVVLLNAGAEQDIVNGLTLGAYLQVGSSSTPANTTAGDLTAVRLFIGDTAVANNSRVQITVSSHVPAATATYYQHLDVTIAPDGSSASERDPFNISYKIRPTANDAGLHIAYRIHMQHDSGAFNLTHASNSMLGTTVVVDQNVALSTVTFMAAFRANTRVLAGTGTTVYGFHASSTGGGTFGTYVGFQADGMTTPSTTTTMIGFRVNNLGHTNITTSVGVDVAAQTGSTNNFGIRNAGNMVQTGYLRLGAITAPTNVTDGDLTLARLIMPNNTLVSASTIMDVRGSITATSATHYLSYLQLSVAPAAGSTASYNMYVLDCLVNAGANSITTVNGLIFNLSHRQTSTLTTAIAAAFIPVQLDQTVTVGVITTATGVQIRPYARFVGTGTVSVTSLTGLEILGPTHAGLTATAYRSIHIQAPSASVITTHVGLDIANLTQATNNIGIRNLSALHQVGNSIFGVDGTPAALVHVQQQTVGNEVLRLESVATNDDPRESVFQNRAATTDATVTTLHTVTIPASTTVMLLALVYARRTGGAAGTAEDAAAYTLIATIKNVAGTATIVGVVAQLTAQEDQVAWDATIDVTGATARVRVTGAANNNITWHLNLKYMPVGS